MTARQDYTLFCHCFCSHQTSKFIATKSIQRQEIQDCQCHATSDALALITLYESSMNAEAEDASFSRMKHFCTAVRPDCDYSSWRAQTCKKKRCIEYLHQSTGLTLQSPGAAHLAVLALPTQKQPSNCTTNDSKAVSAASCFSDTEAGDVCLIITSLDKIVVQLQSNNHWLSCQNLQICQTV